MLLRMIDQTFSLSESKSSNPCEKSGLGFIFGAPHRAPKPVCLRILGNPSWRTDNRSQNGTCIPDRFERPSPPNPHGTLLCRHRIFLVQTPSRRTPPHMFHRFSPYTTQNSLPIERQNVSDEISKIQLARRSPLPAGPRPRPQYAIHTRPGAGMLSAFKSIH